MSAVLDETRTLAVGDTVRAEISGVERDIEIVRMTRWTITTDDWRTWWNHQDGRERGTSVNRPQDRLLL